MHIRTFFGLAGVASNENKTARYYGKLFERCMILFALWLPFQVYLEFKNHIARQVTHVTSWVILLFFIIETITLTCLVDNKKRYLLNNWMNWIIISAGMPFVLGFSSWNNSHTPFIASLRVIQLLVLTRLLLPGWDTTVKILSHNRLGTTLIVLFMITILWGVIISVVDPAIRTPWDGMWLAWETVTTVGYGDHVPTSTAGRVLAVMLMLMGVGLISLLTANFSAYFVNKGTRAIRREEEELLELVREMHAQLHDLSKRIKKLEEKR